MTVDEDLGRHGVALPAIHEDRVAYGAILWQTPYCVLGHQSQTHRT
jgi:hypothetical protein